MSVFIKLCIVMFLQFWIWGAWYTSVSQFMAAEGMSKDIYWVYTAGPLAAIFAPFFLGLIADRFFNTEKILGVLFLLGSISLFILPYLAESGDSSVVNTCIFFHMLCYMPTLALTASLSFKHLGSAEKQFPLVRVFGTIGWIAAGILVSTLDAEKTAIQFWIAGGASALLGLFCFTLPATEAPKKNEPINFKSFLFWDAWAQFKKKSFAVFILSSFIVCIPLASYYAYLQLQMTSMEINNIAGVKTIGQMTEIIFMLLMPFFFIRLGVKKMIAIGIAAWALRYFLFAAGASSNMVSLVIIGIALHGICYDFFFVAGQIYVDKSTPKNIRGQAQSMNIFFTQGLGLYLGAILGGKLFAKNFDGIESTAPSSLGNWTGFWMPLAIISTATLILFLIVFKHKDSEYQEVTN